MFEVNTILLCRVQHVNIYTVSILSCLIWSPECVAFSRRGLTTKKLHKWTEKIRHALPHATRWTSAQVGWLEAVLGICWAWGELEAQNCGVKFFALLQSALIPGVPQFSQKNFTTAEESWDKGAESCESLKSKAAGWCWWRCALLRSSLASAARREVGGITLNECDRVTQDSVCLGDEVSEQSFRFLSAVSVAEMQTKLFKELQQCCTAGSPGGSRLLVRPAPVSAYWPRGWRDNKHRCMSATQNPLEMSLWMLRFLEDVSHLPIDLLMEVTMATLLLRKGLFPCNPRWIKVVIIASWQQ